MEEIKELAELIGIETLGDLEMFKRQEGWRGATLKQALARYILELVC